MRRIANATNEPEEHYEIEITEEMVGRGVSALEAGLGSLPDHLIVVEIYIAMRSAAMP
jgi:hypothetical protein